MCIVIPEVSKRKRTSTVNLFRILLWELLAETNGQFRQQKYNINKVLGWACSVESSRVSIITLDSLFFYNSSGLLVPLNVNKKVEVRLVVMLWVGVMHQRNLDLDVFLVTLAFVLFTSPFSSSETETGGRDFEGSRITTYGEPPIPIRLHKKSHA